jgi:hypothetical protein
LIILYSDFFIIDRNSIITGEFRAPHISPDLFVLGLITHGLIHGCTLLIPKSAFVKVGLFNEGLITSQDYDMWFRAAKVYSFVHLSECLIKGRAHAESITFAQNDTARRESYNLYVAQMDTFIKNPDRLYKNTDYSLSKMAIGLRKRSHKEAGDYVLNRIPLTKFFYREVFGYIYYKIWPIRFNRHYWRYLPAHIGNKILGKNYHSISKLIKDALGLKVN